MFLALVSVIAEAVEDGEAPVKPDSLSLSPLTMVGVGAWTGVCSLTDVVPSTFCLGLSFPYAAIRKKAIFRLRVTENNNLWTL